MSSKHTPDISDNYFRLMVKLHKPVPDKIVSSEEVRVQPNQWEKNLLKPIACSGNGTMAPMVDKSLTHPKRPPCPSKKGSPQLQLHEALFAPLEETPKWLRQRYAGLFDDTKMILSKTDDGMMKISLKHYHGRRGSISEDGKQAAMDENYYLYLKLKAMNLNDPETIEKIRAACSTKECK